MDRRRTAAVGGLLAGVLVAAVAFAPAAAVSVGTWHRDNYGTGHERLTCREATQSWTCVYDNVPEPGLSASDTIAHFSGPNVIASWTCPTWFDGSVCENVVAVYRGNATYTASGNHPVTFAQEQIVTYVEGREILQQYFVDQFYCPWYRTWAEAVAADYNCTFAP
jgi:hypothetical protein